MDSLPPMRPLVMVLKVFLQQRELNEASGCCTAPYFSVFGMLCKCLRGCAAAGHGAEQAQLAWDAWPRHLPARHLLPVALCPAWQHVLAMHCTLRYHSNCSACTAAVPQVYSGGLGSYALLVLVAAFLQLHPSRQPPREPGEGFRRVKEAQ
jgi:hypothetical protein